LLIISKDELCKKSPIIRLLFFYSRCYYWGNRILAQDIIILSYAKYSRIEETYIPLLASVYKELGLTVKFVPLPLDRSIASINSQLVDGDVIRFKNAFNRLDDVVLVSPPLTVIITHLICVLNVPYNISIFKNPNNVILAPNRSVISLKKNLPFEIQAKLHLLDNIDRYIDMLNYKRVKYAIYHADDGDLSSAFKLNFNHVLLSKNEGFHLFNVKYKHLLPQLSVEITKKLNKLKSE